jgi:hypothetical protein
MSCGYGAMCQGDSRLLRYNPVLIYVCHESPRWQGHVSGQVETSASLGVMYVTSVMVDDIGVVFQRTQKPL